MEQVKRVYSWRNLKRIAKKDFLILTQRGPRSLFKQWRKRKNSILLFRKVPGVIAIRLLGSLGGYLEKRNFERRLKRKREIPIELTKLDQLKIKELFDSVSVVINTKNSPEYFNILLNKYRHQRGFRNIEIIIVDSGSTDETLKIAKGFDCKIIEIKPEDFRHGRSRNVGVKAATGRYIVNAVSDATPTNVDLLYKVAEKLEKNKAAAVSVRQIPRNDADTFASWTIWNHYRAMFNGRLNDIWVEGVKTFEKLEKGEQRRLCLIDDVFAFHRSEIIKKELYDNDIRYAEDLDLSIRYIEKNFKIGFLNSESIIHSHTRYPEYFLKRYFVDTNVIYEVFGLVPDNFEHNKITLDTALGNLSSILSIGEKRLRNLNQSNFTGKYLDALNNSNNFSGEAEKSWLNFYESVRGSLLEFVQQGGTKSELDESTEAKLVCLVTGALCAEYLIKNPKLERSAEVSALRNLLEVGV